MKGCANRDSATRCGREPACKRGDCECRSRQLAASLERSESCEKSTILAFPTGDAIRTRDFRETRPEDDEYSTNCHGKRGHIKHNLHQRSKLFEAVLLNKYTDSLFALLLACSSL